ncbi:2-oxo-4-hydroxy-4-carboxy-5-ureidoimidazoline decarboxylase [Acetobacter conturbans]|uniref:2-oxo-4-hydroxy-4-carboxy-5-ureidoimidazoline decarboxylase n=1 Tax=Acetobacter conturbans TaxID=1737472 RepID=A0ABX0K0Z9_9PROT|nr:2-oxo-4-hydroxy-4-carboxy-5-ureidoimidazoline decarboxylase [Acetobacter conturbans]NHN87414.1 2-oxo-4-hydroxy-4-carboxy-5-ureidoimidazoline decarboxylase [Acetobacter conturbans]
MSKLFEQVNALKQDAFTDLFGALYEHSPWIARAVWEHRPFADGAALLVAFQDTVAKAPEEAQMALIREHPELARRVGVDASLTSASRQEQASAGLDRLTPAERAHFTVLNDAYRAKFAMPFIICVRLSEKDHILAEMERRTRNTPDEERHAALAEIDRIAALRCADVLKKLETGS